MDKEELIARLEARVGFQMVKNSTAIIETNDLNMDELLAVTFHKKKEIAFRAAWVLEYMVTHKPLEFFPHIQTFLSLLPNQTNLSAMRHYAKIIVLMTERKSNLLYKEVLSQVNMEPVIEVLFTWLVDTKTPVAVKVHCMQALANLVANYNWIEEELLETIEYLMGIESIAFFARAKMVKKQLKRK